MSKGFRFEPTINYGHEARIKSLERNAFGQVKPPEIKYESARKPGS